MWRPPPAPRDKGPADPKSHTSPAASENHLLFFPNCFFFFFVASLAFRGVVGSVVERRGEEVRGEFEEGVVQTHPETPCPHLTSLPYTRDTPRRKARVGQ